MLLRETNESVARMLVIAGNGAYLLFAIIVLGIWGDMTNGEFLFLFFSFCFGKGGGEPGEAENKIYNKSCPKWQQQRVI